MVAAWNYYGGYSDPGAIKPRINFMNFASEP